MMNYLTTVKDILIVLAACYIGWFVYHSAQSQDQVKALQAVQQQLLDNAKTQDRYRSEIGDAFAEVHSQLGSVVASIDANHKPLLMCASNGGGALPGTPASSPSGAAGTGAADTGSRRDIRPDINAFEKRNETYLGSCRAVLKAWPK